jgi:hypothetical protein
VLAQREEWWRVVNAGGNIVPGQGLGPSVAIKGQYDPERRNIGRLWESPDEFTYMQPTSNGKVKYAGRNRGLFSYIRDRRRS